MRTIKEVFEFCCAVHRPPIADAVKTIWPNATVAIWDHDKYGAAMGVSGITIHDRPAVIAAFQGTKGTWQDWKRNFKVTPDKNGVDRGFAAEWEMYIEQFGHWFSSFSHYGDVYLTGHSQGGPTSAQAAEYVCDKFDVPCSCITFGSPQWCNKTARNRYDIKPINLTNVINPMDIVTRVDPKAERPGKTFELRNPWWHVFVPAFLFVEHTLESYRRDIERTEKILGKD